jgi:hypothetical protein
MAVAGCYCSCYCVHACVHWPVCMNRYACCFSSSSSSSCCCMHACVRGCLRDRHHVSADLPSAQKPPELAPRARPFVRVHSSRIVLYKNLFLHACSKCTFGVGRLNIPVLIYIELSTHDACVNLTPESWPQQRLLNLYMDPEQEGSHFRCVRS